MKKTIIAALLFSVTAVIMISGCEKTDYQHPMHRNGTK
jgi:hypothetical protein